ncbi:Outer membrane protein assembly factor BamA [Bathymodiolus thermophilus thioautotrophic gill symbiont]|uniref:Outer membrane protein assembly factor BamA n=1 Tax=Bathymodiolus thermophilus thioautotrophic gill symbiont TaxID=2360 RepID=A0A3G3ILZ2_9GAMM|nr:outer membrane protein assembly factor BamA [Bathymodiolus thermophilus thioautotrophic gill symbiont]AYQ56728.1 Outer membrane protein assembly factor BamA [Bathymodiolus thermophilus thioautotrophic gill symbiont]
MKKIIVKLVLMASLLSASLAFSVPIKNIEILGLNAISRGTVLSYLPVEVGDDYGTQTSSKIIRVLYKTQFFKDIEVAEEDQVLKIKVIENPYIKYVDFLNNSEKVLDQDTIEKVLSSMDLTQGKIFNKKQLDELIDQVKSTYISQGYYNVKITKNIEIDNQNRVGVELDISEGEIARIKTMRIMGSKTKTEEELLDLFEIGEPNWFLLNYFTEKDHYSKIALDAGIEALKSQYINSGYLDFKVTEVKSELSEDKKNIDIALQIKEGNKYTIGNIDFSGNTLNKSDKSLTKLLTIKSGDVFLRKKIINDIKVITDAYTEQGYAFVKVDVTTTASTIKSVIDLNFKIIPKKKVYINRITITGNTRTQDEVVRREISVYEGGLYSDKALEDSIAKIKRLGFFSNVTMRVSKVKDFSDKIDLNFVVEETKTGTFSVGVSHSSSSGAAFNLGVQEKNFLGTGNVLNASASNSEAVKELSIYFSNPYFTQDGHNINYGIFNKKTDGAQLDVASYKINQSGGSVGYGIPITKNTRITTNLKFSNRDVTCGTDFSDKYEPTQCASSNKTEVKFNANWSHNTLDNYNFPTAGDKRSLNLSVALPIADFRYYKLNASQKKYRPLFKNITFKTNTKIGVAQGYGNTELPFFERFYGGGSSSVRGFDFNSLGEKYENGKAKGGKLSVLTGISVISPLTFVKDSTNMRLSAFIDIGGISEEVFNFATSDLRASAGIAFTWLTPIGPLGLYAAEPFLKQEGDKTKSFEFTIGTSF